MSEYVAGLEITVERLGTHLVFGPYHDCGPLLAVLLDPGLYRVSASFEGAVRAKTMRVDAGAVEDAFYWPDF